LARSGLSLNDQLPGNNGKPLTLGEALMAPTVIYVKKVSPYRMFYFIILIFVCDEYVFDLSGKIDLGA